ncbi:MAG: class I SAM-dependent rRNA methyltransferase [Flavobacteriales bacterium]|nr:class I SAM-dependent rRNA methyltransferase [Flavobacteriales bacterium]
MNYSKVVLHSKKESSVLRKHPWIFSGAIKKIEVDNEINDGDIVEVYSDKGQYLATGHFYSGSIAVRIFSFTQSVIHYDFWKQKIQKAYELRKLLGLTHSSATNVYRLVYAEADELPGLIIDFYNGTAVIQCHAVGMHRHIAEFAEILKEIYGERITAVFDKSVETLHSKQSNITNAYLFGNKSENYVTENNLKFYVDWENGQKTGFFIDQRDHRNLLRQYACEKKILNTFCYSGGFSVYALSAGASEVHSVDSSATAIELTNRNIELNGLSNHTSHTEDTLRFLKNSGEYDIVVLDPPAFAKSIKSKHNAIQGYKRLNIAGIEKVKSNGFLFTFSCSQIIDMPLFKGIVTSAAIESGRNIKIIHHLHQPKDHPTSIFHPEGFYLKGLVLYIE